MDEKFDAVCSECGKDCKIPFKPTEGRPVKCGDCFRKGAPKRSFSGNGGGNKFGGSRDNKAWKKDFDVTCAECGKATTVPFKPTQGKPVLCRDCFKK